MRITIAAIGKMRTGSEAALTGDYNERAQSLGRNIGFSGPGLIEMEAPRGLTGPKRQMREGELLLSAAPTGATIICLDERGKNMPSEKLASLLSKWRDDGASGAAFLIGGADGHNAAVLAKASLSLSFGAATWPHMLVRVMLAEQLYRSMTILSGHPYHRS